MRSPRFDTLTGKEENEKSNLAVRSILMFGLSEKVIFGIKFRMFVYINYFFAMSLSIYIIKKS